MSDEHQPAEVENERRAGSVVGQRFSGGYESDFGDLYRRSSLLRVLHFGLVFRPVEPEKPHPRLSSVTVVQSPVPIPCLSVREQGLQSSFSFFQR